MDVRIEIRRDIFTDNPKSICTTEGMAATAFRYSSGVEALRIENHRGYIVVLPFMGQIIWQAVLDGHDLTMKNMFDEPRQVDSIIDTYGCFMFHSGLLANGCPGPEDDYPLHGEMPCARMDSATLVVGMDPSQGNGYMEITGEYEYVKGFGSHYRASPSVRLGAYDSQMQIRMDVKNLGAMPMNLMYMMHMNYAYIPNGRFVDLQKGNTRVRESIPGHVKPTQEWRDYLQGLAREPEKFVHLDTPRFYDPEICFFMDGIEADSEGLAHFLLVHPDGGAFHTACNPQQFPHVTRWILHNGDQTVAAFALPATCEPEGYTAEKRKGNVIELGSGETRQFQVTTGYLDTEKTANIMARQVSS